MRRSAWFALLALSAGFTSGCVERRFVVNSDPPGALVLRNGKPIGAAPADDHFVYYGNYEFTLIKDGYETLKTKECIRPPWYQWFPLDFVSEVIVPFQLEDVHRFNYTMTPLQAVRPDEQMNRAQVLRQKGKTIGTPPPASPPPAPGTMPPAPGPDPFLAAPGTPPPPPGVAPAPTGTAPVPAAALPR